LAIAVACILIATLAVWALRPFGPPPRPNILLIILDTTRWDHLSCYGYAEKTTPTIDKFAEEAVRYEYAISPSSWTLPAHASLFTGMLSTHHGAHFGSGAETEVERIHDLSFYPLHSSHVTLAEELKKAGYRTAGIVSSPVLKAKLGFGKGFDYYDDYKLFDRRANEVSTLATDWLIEHRSLSSGRPFFLFLNYYDPHTPYNPPAPWGEENVPDDLIYIYSGHYDDVLRGARDLTDDERSVLLKQYDGEIRFMDNQIERLFFEMRRLGLYDSTWIIVTADHGESFGEHRLLEHGRALYEDLIRVPLIMKYPKDNAKKGVIKRRVSILSIMPTILEYIRQPVPTTVETGTLHDKNQVLVSEAFRDITWVTFYGKRFDRSQKALYDGNYKWIWNSSGNHELFAIIQDPAEMNNLAGTLPHVEKRCQARLEPLIQESNRMAELTPLEIDEELKDRLRALGYIR